MLSIILISSNILVKTAVRKAVNDGGVQLVEVERIKDLPRSPVRNLQLVLYDFEHAQQDLAAGSAGVYEIQKAVGKVPVMILSSINKKEIITRFILEGAEDYILKPFDVRLVRDKIAKFLRQETFDHNHEVITIRFDLDSHLRHELYKAKKGGYSFSIMKLQLIAGDLRGESVASKDYLLLSERVFNELKALFWETDVYIQYKVWSHYGFFPFCDHEQTVFIGDKIEAKIKQMTVHYQELATFGFVLNFSTYPTQAQDVETLISGLNLIDETLE